MGNFFVKNYIDDPAKQNIRILLYCEPDDILLLHEFNKAGYNFGDKLPLDVTVGNYIWRFINLSNTEQAASSYVEALNMYNIKNIRQYTTRGEKLMEQVLEFIYDMKIPGGLVHIARYPFLRERINVVLYFKLTDTYPLLKDLRRGGFDKEQTQVPDKLLCNNMSWLFVDLGDLSQSSEKFLSGTKNCIIKEVFMYGSADGDLLKERIILQFAKKVNIDWDNILEMPYLLFTPKINDSIDAPIADAPINAPIADAPIADA